MKRKIFYTFMTTLFVIAGVVACGNTSKKEKVMEKDKIKQEQKTEQQEEIKEEAKEEVKEEMQTETPTQNTEQEVPVEEQPKNIEGVPSVNEQPSVEQPVQNDKTEHSDMPKTEPQIEEGTIGHISDEPPKNYDLDQ